MSLTVDWSIQRGILDLFKCDKSCFTNAKQQDLGGFAKGPLFSNESGTSVTNHIKGTHDLSQIIQVKQCLIGCFIDN